MFIAQMIGKNESERYLQDVLEVVRPLVDLIVFTDDNSDDVTPLLAMRYGAEVAQTPVSLFEMDESLLRQLAWNHLSEYAKEDDWILAIDCDEILYTDPLHLQALLDQTQYDAIAIEFFHMWTPTHYRVDKAWKPDKAIRLFRYKDEARFIDKKLACGSTPAYVGDLVNRGKALWNSQLRMKHLGYLQDEDKKAKYKRYSTIDGGQYHARFHIESIIDTNAELMEWHD